MRKVVYFLAGAIVGAVVSYFATEFTFRDACLDGGGKWDSEWKMCVRFE